MADAAKNIPMALPRPQYCGIGNTNFDALGFSLKHVYYDGRLFPSLMQRFKTVLQLTELAPSEQSPAIGNWLKVLQKIGMAGAYGAVFSGMVGDVVDAVVIKMNRDPDDYEDLRREFRIQQNLNVLRSVCPNFVLALASFTCGRLPTSAQRGDYLAPRGIPMCTTTGDVEFIVMERVQTNNNGPHGESLTFQEFCALPTTDVDTWLALLVQTLLALKLAQRRLQFTHYDLHGRNIMVQGLEGVADFATPATHAVIRYDIDGKMYNVRTSKIAVLIDFGLSHIVTPQGKTIAVVPNSNYTAVGISPQFSAAYDVFMILAIATSSLLPQEALDAGTKLLKELQKMATIPGTGSNGIYLRLGITPTGLPDPCSGLNPDGGLALLRKYFPQAMKRVLNDGQPGDIRLPANLRALEKHYDCGTSNVVEFANGRKVDLAPASFFPPGYPSSKRKYSA